METIGKLFKEARTRKRYSRVRLAKKTKIKQGFIKAIEEENWSQLPDFPVVSGFVKNLALALKMDDKRALAVLRRDYPPKTLRVNPKPDVSERFNWSPRLTFWVGAATLTLAILGYLTFQYLNFVSPPRLEVFSPQEGQVVYEISLEVSGKTDPDAVVKINNQLGLLDDMGNFTGEIEIFEGTEVIEVKATSRSGKETVIRRKITPELE